MKRVLYAIAVASGAGLLGAGCASVDRPGWDVDAVPEGSRLTIEEPIPVSSYSGRAHIQAGESVDPRRVGRFEPSCRIRLHGPRTAVDTIEPGELTVTSVDTRRQVARIDDEPIRLAGAFPGGGTPSYIRHETRLELESAELPEVRAMICSYETANRAPHLHFEHIRDTLAGIAILERP